MKTNCKWKDVLAVYNSLPQYEKLFLGDRFVDSPHTVFRWVERHHGVVTGFIEAYDMNGKGSHEEELILTVAIRPNYRGIGVLEYLHNEVVQFMKRSKYTKLVWFAKDANIISKYCARKLGYTWKYHELDHDVFELEKSQLY